MKKGMDRYATEKRYIKKGYLRKYRNGNPVWKAPEASASNSVEQSREVEEEVIGFEFNGFTEGMKNISENQDKLIAEMLEPKKKRRKKAV